MLKEESDGEVEVVLVGPQKAAETLRKALAMGADTGTHLVTDADLDSGAVTQLLANAPQREGGATTRSCSASSPRTPTRGSWAECSPKRSACRT